MVYTQDPFPFDSVLSFRLLIEHWQQVASRPDSPETLLARHILAELDEVPALRAPIEDLTLLEPHRPLVQAMMAAAFPLAMAPETLAGALVPFRMLSVHGTPAFTSMLEHSCGFQDHFNVDQHDMLVSKAMRAYYWILKQYYGIEQVFTYEHPLIFTAPDQVTGLQRYYKVNFDTRFVDLRKRGPLKELRDDDVEEMINDPLNLERWMELLPPDNFVFEGFGVITGVDVTEQEVMSRFKDDLLQKDAMGTPARLDHLEMRLRTLMQRPDLRLGLVALARSEFNAIENARPMGRSLLLGSGSVPACPYMHQSHYARVFETHEPVIVNDLTACDTCTGFEHYLLEHDLRNLMVAPLLHDDQLIGLLELGSPHPGDINALNARLLDDVLALFATAMKRTLDEREDRVQALIKERYTSLHPVVEWRFRDAALAQLEHGTDYADRDEIVFKDVYPLYALADIRGSSTHRNAAIQADLVEQLGLALMVIVEASTYRQLPILDELGYRIDRFVQDIESGLGSGDEIGVLDFLRHSVEPVFDQLSTFGPRVQDRIDAYRAAIHPDLGILYKHRRAYEASVTAINETISAYLDEREEDAQAMFPHYFEKYKTDGVDYNIFVGASLVADGRFDPLYLLNLRLWQLMTTCGVAWTMRRLKPSLEVPLDIAQLILVQDIPLSIRFRLDEKRFDVDGAYNIRYEIIKKRIDKAYVKGTDERLTQPGTVAVVYSHDQEAAEYRNYLTYLQAAGYLTGPIEEFDLEDMQGVHGLRALRVTVADSPPESKLVIGPDEGVTDVRVADFSST